MLIHDFINNISKLHRQNYKTVKQLCKKLEKYYYDESAHLMILKLDAKCNSHLIKDGEIPKFLKIKDNDLDIKTFAFQLFIPYAIDKLIVYSRTKNKNKISSQNIIELYNTFINAGDIKLKDENDFLNKVFFYLGFEQMSIQDSSSTFTNMERIVKLYNKYPVVNEFLFAKYKLDLEKICVLYWGLFSFLVHNKKVKMIFKSIEFKNYLSTLNIIDENDIENFLKYITIDTNRYKNEYFRIRTNLSTNKNLEYSKLQEIDKFLPKVNHWYPILKIDNNTFTLLSYTSLIESLNLDRLYSEIYNNKFIPDFKSLIHGNGINNYVKNFIKDYSRAKKVFGDEEYYIKRDQYHSPDIIVEYNSFIIIIEMKSKPFNLLDAFHNYDTYNFNKIIKDITKSKKNIQRYLDNVNSFLNKKIFKFIVYFFEHPILLATRERSLIDELKVNDIILTDIQSLELFFKYKKLDLDIVLENYVKSRNNYDTSDLYSFLKKDFEEKEFKESDFFKCIMKKHFK
jgi:hypothetical protein